jgi:hypothetical protein
VCPTFADYQADGIRHAQQGSRFVYFMYARRPDNPVLVVVCVRSSIYLTNFVDDVRRYDAQFSCDDYAARFGGPLPRVVQVIIHRAAQL